MSLRVKSAWPLTILALLALPWWWPLWRTLLSDLWTAAGEPHSAPPPSPALRLGPPAVAGGRVPPNRLLAFQGVRRRVAARRRWEGGFGRRGL